MRNLVILSVAALMACGRTLPESKVSLQEATCKASVLLRVLGNDEDMIQLVLDGRISLYDAVELVGGGKEDASYAIEQMKLCEPLQAPPPAYGNKAL